MLVLALGFFAAVLALPPLPPVEAAGAVVSPEAEGSTPPGTLGVELGPGVAPFAPLMSEPEPDRDIAYPLCWLACDDGRSNACWLAAGEPAKLGVAGGGIDPLVA